MSAPAVDVTFRWLLRFGSSPARSPVGQCRTRWCKRDLHSLSGLDSLITDRALVTGCTKGGGVRMEATFENETHFCMKNTPPAPIFLIIFLFVMRMSPNYTLASILIIHGGVRKKQLRACKRLAAI